MEKVKREVLLEYLRELHPDAKCALDYENGFELLIAIVLSAQTTDKSVNQVTPELFDKYPNIKALAMADQCDVEQIIKRIGLYKNKSKNIIELSKKLDCDGYTEIPNDFSYLISLPGVGRKTTNVFLSEYYNENTLGVDTHILRISKRLGIAKESDDALKCEAKLKRFVKECNFKQLHHFLITFGRNECTAKNPKCESCRLCNNCKEGKKHDK